MADWPPIPPAPGIYPPIINADPQLERALNALRRLYNGSDFSGITVKGIPPVPGAAADTDIHNLIRVSPEYLQKENRGLDPTIGNETLNFILAHELQHTRQNKAGDLLPGTESELDANAAGDAATTRLHSGIVRNPNPAALQALRKLR